MTAVVASREYTLERNDERATIMVQIGMPAIRPDAPWVWYCPFSIHQEGSSKQLTADGADSLQALMMALSALDAILQYRQRGGKLQMLDGTEATGIGLRSVDGPPAS